VSSNVVVSVLLLCECNCVFIVFVLFVLPFLVFVLCVVLGCFVMLIGGLLVLVGVLFTAGVFPIMCVFFVVLLVVPWWFLAVSVSLLVVHMLCWYFGVCLFVYW